MKFEEHDGKLFRMLEEPTPLTPDAEMPCLVRLIQDDSPMGRYNREVFSVRFLCDTFLFKGGVSHITRGMTTEHISRYEVIAEHCPEGSVYWALWQMQNGKTVCNNTVSPNIVVKPEDKTLVVNICDNVRQWLSFETWILDAPKTGWEIHGPKPRLIGHWYKTKHDGYLQYIGEKTYRYAGTDKSFTGIVLSEHHGATLEPDFTNAKKGDKAWVATYGGCTISGIEHSIFDDSWNIFAKSGKSPARSYNYCGRLLSIHTHPTLFHSFEHFLAYHMEAEYQGRQGEHDSNHQ